MTPLRQKNARMFPVASIEKPATSPLSLRVLQHGIAFQLKLVSLDSAQVFPAAAQQQGMGLHLHHTWELEGVLQLCHSQPGYRPDQCWELPPDPHCERGHFGINAYTDSVGEV